MIARDDSPEAIAERIQSGISELKSIGKNAQETIPVSWDKIMEKVVAEYTALIREKKERISERSV